MTARHEYPTLFGCSRGGAGRVIVLGAPYDRGTDAYRAGCARAPSAIREASGFSSGFRLSDGGLFDLGSQKTLVTSDDVSDIGDIRFHAHQNDDEYLRRLSQATRVIAAEGKRPLMLGGDHLVTLAALRGVAATGRKFQVVQLDAHNDYGTMAADDRPTHATFVGYAAAEGLAARIIQIGVRGLSWGAPPAPADVFVATVESLHERLLPGLDVYLTVDTDAFDPTIAQGVGYPEPGGLPFEALGRVLSTVERAGSQVIGADWTEYNPNYDTAHQLTGRTVVRGLAAVIATMLGGDAHSGKRSAA